MFFVYIVECKDGSFYTGWTMDIHKRMAAHNAGKGAKYTRSRYPVALKYFEEAESKQEACKREYAIKKLSRLQKIALIRGIPDGTQTP
ncbi:MAG: hypothetical protein AWM53_00784 [Candidatus Dichloromethanomonas elyunquensis]|nr:MAG: hypothetical protein AWM53_00784 [Candidatus Dichloromethanomonas elyunquensis]